MSERPRTIWIGTDTPFVLEEFRNERTSQLITGVTTGTLKLFNGADVLLSTLLLAEQASAPGSYEVIVPDTQSGLVEGGEIRMQFDISGGVDLTLRLDARAIARVMKDDGL